MRNRIKNFTKIKGQIGESFIWCGNVYKIINVTIDYWLVENVVNGRELKVK